MTEQKQEFIREAAKRIFAKEFNMSKFDIKPDDDDKAPTFVITPTGAMANRVLISGILTAKEKKTEPNVMYTGKLNDNTGNFSITASHFNPTAQQMMSMVKEVPSFVTVVGKPSIYKRDDGRIFTSIRVESIVVTDKTTRDLWILDTARATLDRIAIMKKNEDDWSKGVTEQYKPDLAGFETLVQNAVNTIVE
jgi:RPA family protein